MQLDRTERRLLGSLIEKKWSTPDQYPLTFNALVAACRQKSNRDPVLTLEEFEIEGCLLGLREKGLVIIREREGGHVPRYGERLSEEIPLGQDAAAVMAELLLRGPQTAQELSRRTQRMAPINGVGAVENLLAELARARLVRLLPRGLGQKYARWGHLLALEEVAPPIEEEFEPVAPPAAPTPVTPPPVAPIAPTTPSSEVDQLRAEVAELRERVEKLEESLAPEAGGGADLFD